MPWCRGDEVEKIRAFKDALGLSFEDAAPAHVDVGRRFHRLSNESSKGSKEKDQYRKVYSEPAATLPNLDIVKGEIGVKLLVTRLNSTNFLGRVMYIFQRYGIHY